MNMEIDHIGYAVKHMDRALIAFEELGFVFEPLVDDTDRNVIIVFGQKDGYRIELVCPLDKTKITPIDAYLSKIGPVPYHICYRVKNLEETTVELKKQGYHVVIEPTKAVAFNGHKVVFMVNLAVGLLELVET